MLSKPSSCLGCPLESLGLGFAPPDGPATSRIALLGEALGADEARVGRPFIGQAGGMLQRLFGLLGWERSSVRIGNCVSCKPPNDWLVGAPWEQEALRHCAPHREALLDEGHQVVVTLGATALKAVLGLQKGKHQGVEDFHGTVQRDPQDRCWVVPTFHPSFLQRGAHNLIGTVLWDLRRAERVARDGWHPAPPSLVIDPDVVWFSAWVDQILAASASDPAAYPVSVDIETPDSASGKAEDELGVEDRSYTILRVNLACSTEEGVTVPFQGPYLDHLTRLLAQVPMWYWNKAYDMPRLIQAGILCEADEARALDLMWCWHVLQSDLRRGLGFVAPFYSDFGAWKHLADAEPAWYGAVDGLQTHRCGFGIIADLISQGQWETVKRHVHELHWRVLQPAQTLGIGIDRAALSVFKQDLTQKASDRLQALQGFYPESLRPLSPKGGLTRKPAEGVQHVKASSLTRKGTPRKGKPESEIKQDLYKAAVLVERTITKEVWCCETCGEIEVQRRHRCTAALPDTARPAAPPDLQLASQSVIRFFWQEPFNPDSNPQILAYLKARGHLPGKAKKTKKDTTNRETLVRLETTTKDPFYRTLLDYRAVQKVLGTYAEGTERRLDDHDRVHPTPTFRPSTMRLSYIDPNITNVVSDRQGPDALAAGFRRCVVAAPGCRLLEVDYSAIEAVEVGWFCRDPGYLRLAKLGVHAGLASHVLGRPYDPSWSDADLSAYFKEIKQHEGETYNRSKRFIHGFSYGLSLRGMVLQFPEIFPTLAVAGKFAEVFRHMAPAVGPWQRQVRERASRQHYLGGAGDHPFAYKHWFWSVFTYSKISDAQFYAIERKFKDKPEESPIVRLNGQPFRIGLGEDSKRCIAFYPQSTAAGVLKEAMLRLFDPDSASYIGDAYFGKTPLRAPIHDSLLLEIPERAFDAVYEKVCREMMRPIVQQPCPEAWGFGPYLTIGVAAKVGTNWQTMENLALPVGVSSDTEQAPIEESDQEDWDDLSRLATAVA